MNKDDFKVLGIIFIVSVIVTAIPTIGYFLWQYNHKICVIYVCFWIVFISMASVFADCTDSGFLESYGCARLEEKDEENERS